MEADRRLISRAHHRLWVLLGREGGFTTDVNANGFCVKGECVAQPGAEVSGKISVGDRQFEFTGMVCWTSAIDPHHARMGIRFLDVPEEFKSVFGARQSGRE
jgi:hypothetical protein